MTAIKDAYPSCMRKAKIHLILYLPEIMIQFGPPSAYNTERYSNYKHLYSHNFQYRCESFNSIVRTGNVFSNRQAPSRDIATYFSVSESLRHISSGAIFSGNCRLARVTKYLYCV